MGSKNGISLSWKIAVGFVAGLAFGFAAEPYFKYYPVISGRVMTFLELAGSIFFRLMLIPLVPLILASIVYGAFSAGSARKMGRVFAKTVALYVVTTAAAVVFGLVLGNIVSPGVGVQAPAGLRIETEEALPLSAVLLNLFPASIHEALINTNMLQITIFSLLFGVACAMAGERGRRVASFFGSVAEVMHSFTRLIMKFAPIGVFALTAVTAVRTGLTALLPFTKLIAALCVGCVIHAAVVYSGMIAILCRRSPLWFFRGISEAIMTASATRSSYAALPVSLNNVRDNLGVSQGLGSFVLPLGASINLDGTAIYDGLCAVFAAQTFNIPLTIPMQISIVATATIASMGTAGIPGAGLIVMTAIFNASGLPVEGIAIVAVIDAITDSIRTPLNIVGDAAVCVAVAASEGELQPLNGSGGV